MNSQTRKVAPKTDARRKISSVGVLGFGPQLPIRSSSRVSKKLLQSGIDNRLLSEETKILHDHFNEILLSCGTIVLSEISYCEELNEKYRKYIHFGNIIKLVKSINKLPKKEKLKYDYILKI